MDAIYQNEWKLLASLMLKILNILKCKPKLLTVNIYFNKLIN